MFSNQEELELIKEFSMIWTNSKIVQQPMSEDPPIQTVKVLAKKQQDAVLKSEHIDKVNHNCWHLRQLGIVD